jgi:ketosteroid isomerase-like protein
MKRLPALHHFLRLSLSGNPGRGLRIEASGRLSISAPPVRREECPHPDSRSFAMTDTPIHAFLRDYAAAVYERDLTRFMDLYTADMQVFDSWDRWQHDRQAWAAMAAGWFEGIRDVRVRVTAKDIASWCDERVAGGAATLEFAALDETGKPLRATENRLTLVLRSENGRWRAVHQHTSVPVDFSSKQVVQR